MKRKWFIVETNIQCEVRATRTLRAAGYRVYMPKMRKSIVHHRTKKKIVKRFKLFNRYLFVAFDPTNLDFGRARKCDGVRTILGIQLDGKPWEVSRDLIKRCMLAQRKGEFDDVTVEPGSEKAVSKKRFAVGSRVQVKEGHAFSGFHATVTKIKGRGVIRAILEVFGKAVPVEFSPQDVEPVGLAA